MTLIVKPPMRTIDDPDVSTSTTLDAWIGIRARAREMREADAAYASAEGEGAQWDAMEAYDTASVGLYCLLDLLEERRVLGDIETYLTVTYGRV